MTGTTGDGMRIAARGAFRAAAVAVLLWTAGAAAAEEPADDVVRRMDDRLYFVESLGRGWEPLLADIARGAGEVGEADRPRVLRVRDRAAESYAKLRAADGTEAGEDRALELYVLLAAEAVDETRRPEFARSAATIEVGRAERSAEAGDDDKAIEYAQRAAARTPDFERAYEVVAKVGLKRSSKAEASEDFLLALTELDRHGVMVPPTSASRAKLDGERERILRETGEVAVEWLGTAERLARVKGPKKDFSSATIEFRPAGGGRTRSLDALRPIRVRTGRYELVAKGSAGAELRLGPVDLASDGAAVQIPVGIPDNMQFVPPVGEQGAFLIDRTEVTASEFASPGGANVGGDRLPATGVTLEKAKEYAASAGKELPTIAQWRTAAYGDPKGESRPWPWGSAEPDRLRNFIGSEKLEGPQSVDSLPDVPSAHGCLNMAGNVWEWVVDENGNGWILGGAYDRDSLVLDVNPKDDASGKPWQAYLTRDPAPSEELWQSSQDTAWRERHYSYRVRTSTLPKIGLRCVVPLGHPRRQT